jgi:ABC-type Mn2+/Zn2+ transport system permease subunit
MSWLTEPFQYEFMRYGTIIAVLAGAICGLVGCYVILRNLSSIGHGLSHSIFGGAAGSAVVGVNYYAGAGLWGLLSAVMIGRVARRKVIGGDAAIAIVTTASFAGGLALINRYGSAKKSIEAVLFGSVLGVTRTDVLAIALVGLLAAVVVWTNYRHLLFATFDPEVAAVSGVRLGLVDGLLMLMLATTVLVSMKVLGALLVSALLVTPAASARLLTNSFARMMWISPLIGATAGGLGMFLSYHAEIAPGAAIILVATTIFAAIFFGGDAARRSQAAVHLH